MYWVTSEGEYALSMADSLARKIYDRDRTKAHLLDKVADLSAEWDSALACQDITWLAMISYDAQEMIQELEQYKVYRFQLSDDADSQTTVGVEFVAKDMPEAVRALMDWAPDLEYFVFKGSAKL